MQSVLRPIDSTLEQYKKLLEEVVRDAGRAMARATALAPFFDLVANSGLLDGQVFLGDAVFYLRYAPREGGNDSDRTFQAAIVVPGGFGVLALDGNTRGELSEVQDGIESAAHTCFVPLTQCLPAIQAWLYPQLDSLIVQMLDRLPLKPKQDPRNVIVRVNAVTNHRPTR